MCASSDLIGNLILALELLFVSLEDSASLWINYKEHCMSPVATSHLHRPPYNKPGGLALVKTMANDFLGPRENALILHDPFWYVSPTLLFHYSLCFLAGTSSESSLPKLFGVSQNKEKFHFFSLSSLALALSSAFLFLSTFWNLSQRLLGWPLNLWIKAFFFKVQKN